MTLYSESWVQELRDRISDLNARLVAAEADLTASRAEVERLREAHRVSYNSLLSHHEAQQASYETRIAALTAERDANRAKGERLREALRLIAEMDDVVRPARVLARNALAPTESQEGGV